MISASSEHCRDVIDFVDRDRDRDRAETETETETEITAFGFPG